MKKSTYLLFLLLLLFPRIAFGQDPHIISMGQVNVSQEDNGYTCYQWNKPRNWGSMQAIDTSKLTVTYNFSYAVKDGDSLRTLKDMDILQIGSKVNRFYSACSQRVDSIAFNYLMSLAQKWLDKITPDWTPSRLKLILYGWIPEGVCPLYMDVYSYPSEKRRTVSSRFQYDEYRYSEQAEPFNWIMVPGVDTVMGYPCNKAEATFRGRKWTAYYTFDIPCGYGPWKFSGLPGLILKVTDGKGLFRWEAVGIGKPAAEPICDFIPGYCTDKRIYVWIPDRKVRKCSRKEMEKLWKRFWNAPLSIRVLDRMEATFVDGKNSIKVSVSDPVPDDFYPRLELE